MRGLSALCLLAFSGCFVTYTPPVRGVLPGMPDRLAKDQLEVAGEVGGIISAPTTGGPRVSYALSDTLTLEAGGNLDFVVGLWATTYIGARINRRWQLSEDVRFSADFEFGGGAGMGGRDSAGTDWKSLAVGGVYDGIGVGLRWRWLGAFIRARVDGAASNRAPMTLWALAAGGLEAKILDRVVVSASAGSVTMAAMGARAVTFFLYQFGISILLGEML